MKFFLDTEFKEYHKQPKLFGIPSGDPIPTIDLISIGIFSEAGKEYYALNQDCDINEVWADKWLRENVLQKIYEQETVAEARNLWPFTRHTMKSIFLRNGKGRREIALEIEAFVNAHGLIEPQFYAYFADYDWVVFCQLFGRMMDLPKNFPMYCLDLKQIMASLSLNSVWKKEWCPEDKFGAHNALEDAKWNYRLFLAIRNYTNKWGKSPIDAIIL
jgi:hypothetical protein